MYCGTAFNVCQMTGLDVEKCHLLEVACIITDDELNVIAKVCCCSLTLSQHIYTYRFLCLLIYINHKLVLPDWLLHWLQVLDIYQMWLYFVTDIS